MRLQTNAVAGEEDNNNKIAEFCTNNRNLRRVFK